MMRISGLEVTGGCLHLVTVPTQRELEELSDVGIVIHDENPGHVSTLQRLRVCVDTCMYYTILCSVKQRDSDPGQVLGRLSPLG